MNPDTHETVTITAPTQGQIVITNVAGGQRVGIVINHVVRDAMAPPSGEGV